MSAVLPPIAEADVSLAALRLSGAQTCACLAELKELEYSS